MEEGRLADIEDGALAARRLVEERPDELDFPDRSRLWIEPADPVLLRDITVAARWMIEKKAAVEDALLVFGG